MKLMKLTPSWEMSVCLHGKCDRKCKCLKKVILNFSLLNPYKKTFDTVNHQSVLNHFHNWFKSYIGKRMQCVKIKESFSTVSLLKIRVSQSSVLGPIMFLIYINDPYNVNVKGKLASLLMTQPFAMQLMIGIRRPQHLT